MDIELQPGTYVVAVSGGVDSMVLLYCLKNLPGVKLTVAHFDHGIREDSAEDRKLVQATAKRYGLPFVHAEGRLGKDASEALARERRYEFLRQVQQMTRASAIITGHHQDDVLETAVLNLIRGTGRRGLTSLKSTDGIIRPFLKVPKEEIVGYALAHKIAWREDSTNQEDEYFRNFIRHHVIHKFKPEDRQAFLRILRQADGVNQELDLLLNRMLRNKPKQAILNRSQFLRLPFMVGGELLVAWLRLNKVGEINRKLVDRLNVEMRVKAPGKKLEVSKTHYILVAKDELALKIHER